jgi:hypothetical protein
MTADQSVSHQKQSTEEMKSLIVQKKTRFALEDLQDDERNGCDEKQ